MKKILLFLMSVVMFAACSGCGQSQGDSVDSTKVDTTVVLKDSATAGIIDVNHAIAVDRL